MQNNMIVILAEKPSVARSIADVLGAKNKREGYIEGNGYAVTYAFGHLIELYNTITTDKWHETPLPILEGLALKQKSDKAGGVKRQLKIIKDLFEKANEIIVATDAGREGELIFRYIYGYLGCKTPFSRLWISSLTDNAIREGFKNLKRGSNYDNLYLAGKARSEADWLVGVNATRALTLTVKNGEIFSLGRVQTPTLAIICSRFIENRDFKSQPFWTVIAKTEKNGTTFELRLPIRYMEKGAAQAMNDRVKAISNFRVISVTKSEKKEHPPLLYDLTNLQKAASTKLNFTPDTTLNIAQSLYEKKYITYPRTGSRYISEDVFQKYRYL